METCDHRCSGNCRRVGCNCSCGEFHEVKVRAFSNDQLAQIERHIAEDRQDEIQEESTSMEEKLEEILK
jgi:hypothetical protein